MVLVDSGERAFGVLTSDQTMEVVSMYRAFGSYERASLHLSFPYSWPAVARLIRWSIEVGMLAPEEQSNSGNGGKKLARAKEVVRRYPHKWGYSRSNQAAIAEVGTATIYRALKNE